MFAVSWVGGTSMQLLRGHATGTNKDKNHLYITTNSISWLLWFTCFMPCKARAKQDFGQINLSINQNQGQLLPLEHQMESLFLRTHSTEKVWCYWLIGWWLVFGGECAAFAGDIIWSVIAAIVPCDSYVIVAAAPSRISISAILSIWRTDEPQEFRKLSMPKNFISLWTIWRSKDTLIVIKRYPFLDTPSSL